MTNTNKHAQYRAHSPTWGFPETREHNYSNFTISVAVRMYVCRLCIIIIIIIIIIIYVEESEEPNASNIYLFLIFVPNAASLVQ